MTCEHNWRGKNWSAPHDDGAGDGKTLNQIRKTKGRHVVDMHCSKCKKHGVEIYTFEGFEEGFCPHDRVWWTCSKCRNRNDSV